MEHRSRARRAIGVDIGGTTIKLGVVDLETGAVEAESSFVTPQLSAESTAAAIATNVRSLLAAYPEIDRLGVGVPGAMNADRSLVRFPPNLSLWKEEPLAEFLGRSLPELDRIEVDNDAKVATLAEAKLGAGRGEKHFLLVTLGTGVGGGIYLTESNTEGIFQGIVRGASGGAGEFGHVSIDYSGPKCGCGSRGCIEAYLGQRYLSNRTRAKLVEHPEIRSVLRDSLEGEITPRLIAEAMHDGDEFATSVFVEAGELLGFAMANVAKLLDIHLFVVGGGIAEAGDVLFDSAYRSLYSNVLPNQKSEIEIRRAQFANKAGIVGAALLVG